MQIILLHFGEVFLKNQGKKTNSAEIEKWTGVKNYDAHEDQIQEICHKIFKTSYQPMKHRLGKINLPDTTSSSSNFILFLEHFEDQSAKWITDIQNYLTK